MIQNDEKSKGKILDRGRREARLHSALAGTTLHALARNLGAGGAAGCGCGLREQG